MHRWRAFSMLMALGLVVAACTSGSPSPSAAPSSAPPASEEPPMSMEPFVATSYPAGGPADCAYGGEMSQITAVDEHTVRFDLCYPDPAFLSKIAFTANAIHDTAWLEANMENHLILARPNGTGPYKFKEHVRGDHITLEKFDGYWGTPAIAQEVIFQWNSEAAARLLALQAGTVDGIDNPGTDDFAVIAGNPDLALKPRDALNVFYVGITNTHAPWDNPLVRQAVGLGIDRQRIVDNFYPGGSTVASHFTPCPLSYACEGSEWPAFDPAAGRALLAEAGFPNGFATTIYYRDVVRSYLPTPGLVAADIQAQLLANLNITAAIEQQESGTFIDNSSQGLLDGLHLLGWGADYPDTSNFLDYHFNNPANLQFGNIDPSVSSAIAAGGQTLDPAARAAAYGDANDAIVETVPMIPIAHGGSGTAFRADVAGAHSSPLGNEYFAVMDPGGRSTLVWMQNAYPLSLYCADETDGETLRVCEQVMEALYSYEIGSTGAVPQLAEECVGNAELTSFTCTLRQGVLFHDGSHFDANDVVASFAVQWDAAHPLHVGRTGSFEYFAAFFAQFLNAPE
jgi:peptide/nickel transport system substrate-binding protein